MAREAKEQGAHQSKMKHSENGTMVDLSKRQSVEAESLRLVEDQGTERYSRGFETNLDPKIPSLLYSTHRHRTPFLFQHLRFKRKILGSSRQARKRLIIQLTMNQIIETTTVRQVSSDTASGISRVLQNFLHE